MTEKQLDAVRDRIQKEIRLYAPDAEVSFAKCPVQRSGREEWEQSEDWASLPGAAGHDLDE
jgi:hypothetical protein